MNDSPASEVNVTQPAQEVVTQPQAETPPWAEQTQTPATEQGTPATAPNEQEEQRKQRGGFQRRIDELVREREYERAEKQRLHDLLARQTSPQPQQQPQPAGTQTTEKAPTIEQFDSYEKYLSAYARWEAKAVYEEQRKIDQERTQKEQTEAKQKQTVEQQQRAIRESYEKSQQMTREAEKKYPDFYEKVFQQSPELVPISPVVGQAILEAEQGADIAYYLGTHPEEAQRIAKLSPTAQLREFGKLEVSLAKQQSAAPAPINPVGGNKAGSELPSEKDDMPTWIAKRNRQRGRK